MTQKIVPFVDHEIGYRLLQKLIVHASAGSINIPAVVTTCENGSAWWPGVDELCKMANIPLFIYEASLPEDFFSQRIDWILLLSWKHIIPESLISLPRKGVLNLHYSLLPAFRGVYPVNWAIINGASMTGFTYHFVNEKIDDGEIFMQIEVPINLSDSARTLQLRIDDAVYDNFDDLIHKLSLCGQEGWIKKSQSKPKTRSDYFSRDRFKSKCLIDLDGSYRGADFFNLLRGLTFLEDSENAYILDSRTGEKIFFSLNIKKKIRAKE
ncbi:formyltransferase family protein [Castellaniella hirudinis]|uniref:Formyltransferase family protein n=1 Tax=Castellaniella hirudinis TaxID=1144617 RepID=A0ABV8RTL1_9BURK